MNSTTVIISHGPITGGHSQGLCTDSLTWPFYNTSRRSTMVFDTPKAVVEDPYVTERDAWGGASFEMQP